MIFLFLKKDVFDILKKFIMLNFKTISRPINTGEKLCINDGTSKIDEQFFRRTVGSLIYLTYTRQDTMFPISMTSIFMHCSSSHHLGA